MRNFVAKEFHYLYVMATCIYHTLMNEKPEFLIKISGNKWPLPLIIRVSINYSII